MTIYKSVGAQRLVRNLSRGSQMVQEGHIAEFPQHREGINSRQGPRLTFKSKWVGEPDLSTASCWFIMFTTQERNNPSPPCSLSVALGVAGRAGHAVVLPDLIHHHLVMAKTDFDKVKVLKIDRLQDFRRS